MSYAPHLPYKCGRIYGRYPHGYCQYAAVGPNGRGGLFWYNHLATLHRHHDTYRLLDDFQMGRQKENAKDGSHF